MWKRNPVQNFIRNLIRLIIIAPLWYLLVWPDFQGFDFEPNTLLFWNIAKTIGILWFANILARMFHVLPQWQRLVLLRLGRSVGARGPGIFIVPPFIYSVARILDVRIITYEVKATKTLTRDNIPIDVTAAVELEIEDPEKAAIDVKDYWKTTEWVSMEALKSTIGGNDLRPLLSETARIATDLKRGIDEAAKDYGVNVRAERSAKAKKIQAIAEASRTLASQPNAMDLRQIQALLEISKEESAMVIVYPTSSFMGQQIATAAAGSQSMGKEKSVPKLDQVP